MKNQTFKLTNKAYEAPVCSVMEINPEGVLCQSTTNGDLIHDGIDGDDGPIF